MAITKLAHYYGIFSVKNSCPKCYGRGYTGTYKDTGKKLYCNCITIIDMKPVPDNKDEDTSSVEENNV